MSNESPPRAKALRRVHSVEVALLLVMLALVVVSLFMLNAFRAELSRQSLSHDSKRMYKIDPEVLDG